MLDEIGGVHRQFPHPPHPEGDPLTLVPDI